MHFDVLANFSRLAAMTLLGWWFLGLFEALSWVVLVACIIPWVDAYSVWRGPTKEIVTHHEHVFSVLSFAFPVPGENNAANLGMPDLLFFALFLAASARFELRVYWTWVCLVAGLGATIALTVWFDLSGLPALPGDRDRLSRSECGSDLASTETASAGVARSSAFASLRVPAFRWWFLAQIVSGSGNMAQGVGMAWLVLQLSGSSVDLGLVSVAMFAPVLLTGAWAGVLLDHVDHRRTLMATQIAGCALAFTLGLLTTTGAVQIWMIFALAAAGGFVFAIDQPARQLYVIELVGRERVQSAVGLFEVIINASRVLGPAVGGVVIALFGVAACFYVNAATFVVPLLVLLWLRPRARPERAPRPNTLSALREGFRFVRHSPAILACLGMAAASGMLFNLGVALPVLATRAFGLGSIGYGLLFASFGLGAIPGGLAAARSHGAPRGRQVRLLCLITGIVVVATAYAPWTPLAYVLLALAGFFSIWFIALANTLVQLRPAPNMRGRVMGLWTMALPGLNPVTGLMVGAVAELAGPREGFALAGVTLAIAALAGWRALSD